MQQALAAELKALLQRFALRQRLRIAQQTQDARRQCVGRRAPAWPSR
jgi:hypothetical protein